MENNVNEDIIEDLDVSIDIKNELCKELEDEVLALIKQGVPKLKIPIKLNISETMYSKIIKELQKKGLYNVTEEKAKNMKKIQKKYNESDNKMKLSKEENFYRKKCIDFLSIQLFDYNREKNFNSMIPKDLAAMARKYNYKILYFTIQKMQNQLLKTNKMTFSTNFQKTKYIMAIIRSGLNDTKRNMKKLETKYPVNIEDEIEAIENIEIKERTDLSNLIDD